MSKTIILMLAVAMLLLGCTAQKLPSDISTGPSVIEDTIPTETTAPQGYLSQYPMSNPNANETTRKLYDYLCSLSGKYTLSGQMESTWMGSPDYEMNIVYKASGKYPAIRGLDYMHDDFTGVNQRAIAWWNKGGIVTIMWHTGCDFYGEWADALDDTISDWDKVLTPGTPEHEDFLAGMDKAAKALLELQEADVPVIWRPFHEFDGRWFWWGKGGSENFIKLWQLMYDRYTNHWGLNNLIWVLPYSGNGVNYSKWYPGDAYCDIVGADSYGGGVQNGLYKKLTYVCDSKPYCFHECGVNPTAEELQTTPWIWFMTWHTDYISKQNTTDDIHALYNSDYVLTLDELPSFKD